MAAPKFEIYKNTAGRFYFHLKAGNGEKILESQTYASKEGAKAGIASIKLNAPNAEVHDYG